MKLLFSALLLIGIVLVVQGTVYFQEDFGEGWESRWVVSKVKEADGTLGKWAHSAGKYFNDEARDRGIQTSEDARFYQISAAFPQFSNKGKDLVLQYSVKFDQAIDCGGAYIKLLPPGLDQEKFEGDSAYNVMFGPDVCGSTRRVHAILSYKGQNYLIKKNVYPETEQYTSHLYTFILRPDQTYEILIDGVSKQSGSITEDWEILPPRQIPDPSVSKPSDWVDEAKIADPEAVKPAGWDDIPKEVADPDAKKPEDWDEELDGEWEAPQIPNPEYKGEWRAPLIDNPAYKGEWVHPLIDNPEYFDDPNIYAYEHGFVGIEIWQVKSGTVFDNILVTDSVDEARAFADGYFKTLQEGEKAKKEEDEKVAREEAAKLSEAQAAAGTDAEVEAEGDSNEDGDDDDEEGAHHDHDHEL
jgi:calreticulin